MRKILIIGPLVDNGGREVETNIIAKSLENDYDLTILSTVYATPNSIVGEGLKKTFFTTLDKEFIKTNFIIFCFAFLFFIKNKFKGDVSLYVKNKLTFFFFNYSQLRHRFLLKYIDKFDLVILEMEFRNSLYPEIIEHCLKNNKPCFFRTTRTIFNVSKEQAGILKNVDLFIHHSEENAKNLDKYLKHKYIVIDQCAFNEDELLKIEINPKQKLRYGFLGRLNNSKQIIPLTQFFLKTNHDFYIGGDGELKEELISLIDKSDNCFYLGYFESNRLGDFFKKIDVLIISSLEESGPLVGVEALAAGKIVVSTKVGAMPERFENFKSPFWFDKDDIKSIGDIIDKLESLSKNERNEIFECYRKLYLEKMSQEVIQKKYLEAVKSYLE